MRALNGYDLELLEQACLTKEEWLSSVMSLIYSNKNIEELSKPISHLDDDYQQQAQQRLAYLCSLPISEYDNLYIHFLELWKNLRNKNALSLNIIFSDIGVVIGGADQKASRFCCNATFGIFFEQ